jgi:hypothetical protein
MHPLLTTIVLWIAALSLLILGSRAGAISTNDKFKEKYGDAYRSAIVSTMLALAFIVPGLILTLACMAGVFGYRDGVVFDAWSHRIAAVGFVILIIGWTHAFEKYKTTLKPYGSVLEKIKKR